MNLIKKIQQQSRSTRLLILWLATFLVMVIIVLIWLFSFSKNLALKETEKEVEETGLPSLFKSIEKDFSIFKQQLQGSVEDIEEIYEQEQEQEQQE